LLISTSKERKRKGESKNGGAQGPSGGKKKIGRKGLK